MSPPTLVQNVGKIIPTPRGKFNASANPQYKDLDEVSYFGEIYRVKKNLTVPTGVLPTNTTYWVKTAMTYSQESVYIEKLTYNNVRNFIVPLPVTYEKIEVELYLTFNQSSLLVFDVKNVGGNFPSVSSYDSLYTASDNYEEVNIDVVLRSHAKVDVKTKLSAVGAGYQDDVFIPFDAILVANAAGISDELNVVVLNNATMSGYIFVKKYNYLEVEN